MTQAAPRSRDVHAFARFLVVGVSNTGITFALYLLLLHWFDYRTGYTISFLAGIFLAYELNRVFVFRARRVPRSVIAVPLIYALQYLVGIGIVSAAVVFFGIPRPYAPLLAIAVTVPMTFLLNRWAFSERNA